MANYYVLFEHFVYLTMSFSLLKKEEERKQQSNVLGRRPNVSKLDAFREEKTLDVFLKAIV